MKYSVSLQFVIRCDAVTMKLFSALAVLLIEIVLIAAELKIVHQSSNANPEFIKALQKINEMFAATEVKQVRIISNGFDSLLGDYFSTVQEDALTFKLIDYSKLELFQENPLDEPALFNIIEVDSVSKFIRVASKPQSHILVTEGFYFILLEKCNETKENQIFGELWHRYIHNVNILCSNSSDAVSIKTFEPFTAHSCGNTSSIVRTNTETFSIKNLFPEKLKNLFGCPIKLATFFYPPITMRDTLENGSSRYYGSEMEMVFGLAQALNFTVNMTYIAQSGFTGLLYENGTATGIMKETIEGKKEMLMGFYYLTFLRTQHMSFTQSHYSIPLVRT